ncbi:MAG: cell division ATP-binding protein FtsE [Clostridia bacterium]|nr:cell division ATP-binding protein FtsE [Clostridia bacterium]MBQ5820518.1 cell division ATP-binding protein FtsE [Clostridia bacterium]
MIQFVNVSKRYEKGDTVALRKVNLRIEDGEFVFIVGNSGAGKSTMVHLLTCEDVPTRGDVIVDGQNTKQLSRRQIPKYRRRIGIVFQDFRLIPNLNVYDNIAFSLRVVGRRRKEIKRRVARAMELVGLSHKAKAYPDQLSGGEQQRVAVARAIVNNPTLIIADEPTGNVDPSLSLEIMEMLLRINRMGITVVVVTHEQHLVDRMDQRVIRIEKGRVVTDTANEFDYDETEAESDES